MPRPRFENLSEEKRHSILESAAKIFAEQGFTNASMNQILSDAGVSKGAAYYYFDDKADLFLTVVQYYIDYLFGDIDLNLNTLTADTFWPEITNVYKSQFKYFKTQPWTVGVAKAISSLSSQELESASVVEYLMQVMGMLSAFVNRGQELGVLRTDLPDDLLLHIISGLDNASDSWLIEHWDELDDQMISDHVNTMFDILKSAIGVE